MQNSGVPMFFEVVFKGDTHEFQVVGVEGTSKELGKVGKDGADTRGNASFLSDGTSLTEKVIIAYRPFFKYSKALRKVLVKFLIVSGAKRVLACGITESLILSGH
jgi:hypothetical protein